MDKSGSNEELDKPSAKAEYNPPAISQPKENKPDWLSGGNNSSNIKPVSSEFNSQKSDPFKKEESKPASQFGGANNSQFGGQSNFSSKPAETSKPIEQPKPATTTTTTGVAGGSTEQKKTSLFKGGGTNPFAKRPGSGTTSNVNQSKVEEKSEPKSFTSNLPSLQTQQVQQ